MISFIAKKNNDAGISLLKRSAKQTNIFTKQEKWKHNFNHWTGLSQKEVLKPTKQRFQDKICIFASESKGAAVGRLDFKN